MGNDQDPKILMERAKAGDREAFSLLYTQYATPLYRYLYFRLLSKEDTEDMLQTVFLKAYQALPQFRDTGKHPLSFFYTIARNAVIDHRRKRRELVLEDGDAIAENAVDEAPEVTDLIAARADGAMVREAMQRLSDDQREAITLRFINDLSNTEIAQLMGKQEAAVRQLESRGIRALRALLTKSHGIR